MKRNTRGLLIAGAVCSMLAAAVAHAGDTKAEPKAKEAAKIVKCGGVNECKGKGACGSATNDCKSHNSCKGKGWVEAKSEADCKTRGGTVVTM